MADPLDTPDFEFALGNDVGECTATITKRPFVGGSIKYFFEYSNDLIEWTLIEDGDPNFEILVDNDTTLTVSNINMIPEDRPAPSCYLRLVVTN